MPGLDKDRIAAKVRGGTSAGWSFTQSLGAKLGLKAGLSAKFIALSESVARELAQIAPTTPRAKNVDFIHWFVAARATLTKDFAKHKAALCDTGALWVSWRKGGAKPEPSCEVSENLIREIGRAAGLVDVKVCAVDERWSGLKFVYRLSDRGGVRK